MFGKPLELMLKLIDLPGLDQRIVDDKMVESLCYKAKTFNGVFKVKSFLGADCHLISVMNSGSGHCGIMQWSHGGYFPLKLINSVCNPDLWA